MPTVTVRRIIEALRYPVTLSLPRRQAGTAKGLRQGIQILRFAQNDDHPPRGRP